MTGSSDELVLAVDCGTQSVRALLVDLKGNIVAKRQQALEAYSSAQAGWLEHDAEAFWTASAAVCRGVFLERPDLKPRVKGMAVTTQRGSLTLVDQSGKPLRPFIIWLDQRRARRPPSIPAWWRLAFIAARVSGTVDHLAREAELNWIAEHEPEQLRRAHKALLVSAWLNYRLTGRFVELGGFAGRLPSVRFQAPGLGAVLGLEMERARRAARANAGPAAGWFDPRRPDQRRRRGDGAAGGAAGGRGCRRQGL